MNREEVGCERPGYCGVAENAKSGSKPLQEKGKCGIINTKECIHAFHLGNGFVPVR